MLSYWNGLQGNTFKFPTPPSSKTVIIALNDETDVMRRDPSTFHKISWAYVYMH